MVSAAAVVTATSTVVTPATSVATPAERVTHVTEPVDRSVLAVRRIDHPRDGG